MATAQSLLRRLLAQGQASVPALASRMDSWVNVITGLGSTLRDKAMGAVFQGEAVLTVEECHALFHHDDMANRICSAVPDEAMREGFEVHRTVEEDEGEDQDVQAVQEQKVALQNRLRALETGDRVREAMTFARCTGGAAVLLMVDGSGPPETPLVDERVTRVEGLLVVDRGDLTAATWYALGPKLGEVETWYLNIHSPSGVVVSNVRVHETRLVMFRGAMTSRQYKVRNQGWDHSVLQRCINILRQTNTAWDSVVHMMNDMSQAVFKIHGLIDSIAEGDSTAIQTRMALVDMVRSVARAIVLDSESEDFKVVERGALTGTGDLVDKLFLRLAAAARMPVTILMGQSPAGLNATGASDLRWWYDTIRVAQNHEVKPRLERIVRIVAREQFPGEDPAQWEVLFPSLWQMTPQEEADLRAKVASTDKTYVDMEALLPEEIALSRWGSGKYSTEYVVDLEVRKAMLDKELERAEEDAGKPPPAPPGPPGQLPPGQEPQDAPEDGNTPTDGAPDEGEDDAPEA